MEMIFCTGCGKQLPANAKFCKFCGTRLEAPAVPEPEVQVEPAADTVAESVAAEVNAAIREEQVEAFAEDPISNNMPDPVPVEPEVAAILAETEAAAAPAQDPAPEPVRLQGGICPTCGAPLAPGAVFCTACGTRLDAAPAAPAAAAGASRCPNCGAELAPGASFCTTCGMRMTQPAAPVMPVQAAAVPQQKKKSRVWIPIVIAAGVVVIAAAVLLFLFKDSIFGTGTQEQTGGNTPITEPVDEPVDEPVTREIEYTQSDAEALLEETYECTAEYVQTDRNDRYVFDLYQDTYFVGTVAVDPYTGETEELTALSFPEVMEPSEAELQVSNMYSCAAEYVGDSDGRYIFDLYQDDYYIGTVAVDPYTGEMEELTEITVPSEPTYTELLNPADLYDFDEVESLISAWTDTSNVSFLAASLTTGDYSGNNVSTAKRASSLVAVPVLYAACELIYQGEADLDTPVTFHYTVENAGYLASSYDGTDFTLVELLRFMLHFRDYNAINSLIDFIGTDRINSILNGYGYSSVNVTGHLTKDYDENYVSAVDLGGMLWEFYNDYYPCYWDIVTEGFVLDDIWGDGLVWDDGLAWYIYRSDTYIQFNGYTDSLFNEILLMDFGDGGICAMVFLGSDEELSTLRSVAADLGYYVRYDLIG